MKSYFLRAVLFLTILTIFIVTYTLKDINLRVNKSEVLNTSVSNRNDSMKYILQWTSDTDVPFVDMGKGQEGFIKRKCPYTNCFVTPNKFLLGDYTEFDVIAFAGPELLNPIYHYTQLPQRRSAKQKFVFVSIESAGYYSACSDQFNNFFNWTWTYKLNSDVRWGYIVIRDKEGNIIGPRADMNWIKLENMNEVPIEFKNKLKSKRKAVAWFSSNCFSASERETLAQDLRTELFKYKRVLDVYGSCGNLVCSRDNEAECDKKIGDTYYFYLSFENAFSEDYVTEKLLRALNNDAIPIVYGGANYTRFMPDGIYLNAIELGVVKLAEKINDLISDPDKYAAYFKWRNHYSYHKTSESVETNEYCKICEALNDGDALNTFTVYDNFEEWWDPPNICWENRS